MGSEANKRCSTAHKRNRYSSLRKLRKTNSSMFASNISNVQKYESSNTLRNSILPQSFPKGERFRMLKPAGFEIL